MAMEFLIKQLPSVQIPPIEGIADRLQFGIDNLDLSSFVIHKEDVHMKLGNFARTGNLFEVSSDPPQIWFLSAFCYSRNLVEKTLSVKFSKHAVTLGYVLFAGNCHQR